MTMIDWAAISGIADLYQLVKEIFRNTSSHNEREPVLLSPSPIEEKTERYQVLLGRRHEFLRDKILQLNPREMADFYGFEKADYLHDCEEGLDEFPTEAIKKLVQVFFIRPKYLQEGEFPIFQTFDIISTREKCRYFLEQKFYPYFLCSPTFEQDGEAYLAFWKEDEGYWRMIKSNTVGGFYSSGGGAQNIYNLIIPMLDLKMKPLLELKLDPRIIDLSSDLWRDISFLNTSKEEWKNLESGCWYNKEMRGYVGAANHQARDIFERWFKKAQEMRFQAR